MFVQRQQLRQQHRQARREISASVRQEAEKALLQQFERILGFEPWRHVACYLPNDGEMATQLLINALWAHNIAVYLPVVPKEKGSRVLQFARYAADTALVKNRFAICEPRLPDSPCLNVRALDLVLMPLVAFDAEGHRLGMGGGYYDSTFSFLKGENQHPVLVGMAFESQREDAIEPVETDISLAAILTDKHFYKA